MNNNSMINIHSIPSYDLEYNKNELRSYLGVKSNEQFEELYPTINCLAEEVIKASTPKACWREIDLNIVDGNLMLNDLSVESKDLSKNLLNCDFAIVFCATLGIGVDRLIKKQLAKSSAKGVITNAVASSYIEGYCDILNQMFKEKYRFTQPRYSCGYGDFKISFQKDLLSFLKAEKMIGVYCTDNFLLIPSKTVTAVIGVKKG